MTIDTKVLYILELVRSIWISLIFINYSNLYTVLILFQYDLSASQFSPDGRVFQVEYAIKAVENSGTAIGLRCKDGVVFGVEKLVTSKLYEPTTNKRIYNIDRHIGMVSKGK